MRIQKQALMLLTIVPFALVVMSGCSSAAPAPTAAPAAATKAPAAAAAATAPAAAAAAPTTAAAAAPVKQGEFIIKASGSMTETEPGIVAYQEFKKNVEARSNGRIQVQIYPANQLGNERDVIEGLTLNSVQMVNPSNAPLTAWVPEMNIFELPFIWRDEAHMTTVLDGPIGAKFAEPLKAKGLHLLGYETAGLRHIMTTKKAINTPEDLKGLKIRTMENPVHLDAFKAMGASPLPMAYGELYNALQQGVLDGAEAANTNYYSVKFYEVATNWGMVGWLNLVSPLLISEKFYQGLPADLQTIVTEEGKKTAISQRKLYTQSDSDALTKLKAAGIKVTTPDRQPFIKAASPVWDTWASKVGGRAAIDEIANAK